MTTLTRSETLTAQQVADYLLSASDKEEPVSPLKLQKLLYYCQGFYLAMHNKPLFGEVIQAWDHGPVVPEIYQKYKNSQDNIIEPPSAVDETLYTQEQIDLMDEVLEVYGQFSAWKLRNMTHAEPPWQVAYAAGCNNEIPHESLRSYFSTLIE